MKKKYIAILLGITLGMTTLVGCSRTNTSESSTIQESQSVTGATENSDKRVSEAETADVYGEVTAVSEDSITIKVGTMKQREKPDNAGAPGDSSNAQSSDDKTDSDSTEKGSENTDSSENKSDNSSDSRNAQPPENMEKPDGDGQGAPSMLADRREMAGHRLRNRKTAVIPLTAVTAPITTIASRRKCRITAETAEHRICSRRQRKSHFLIFPKVIQ